MTPKILTDFFDRAKRIVTSHHEDRDKRQEGGGLESSWAHIARVYTALTGKPMTEREALTFMQVVKLVREERDPRFTEDHYDDLIGYTALKGVVRRNEQMGENISGNGENSRNGNNGGNGRGAAGVTEPSE